MNRRFALAVAYTLCAIVALALAPACSPNAGGTAEYYNEAGSVDVKDRSHPDYANFSQDNVFFGAFLSPTNHTVTSGNPPYSISVGAYSLSPDSVQVEILSARAIVNGGKDSDFFGLLDSTLFQTRTDVICQDCGHYGIVWSKTGHFLNASPSDGDRVTVRIRFRIGRDDNSKQMDIEFSFDPEVKRIGLFRMPT